MKKSLKLIGLAIALVLLLVVLTGCVNNEVTKNAENNVEETEVVETKELSRGKWENNVYTNEFADIKFRLPEGWNYSSDEEIASMMNISVDLLNEDQQSFAKIAEQTSVYDMVATNPNTASSVMVMFEKPLIKVSTEYYISKVKSELEKLDSINYTISDDVGTANIAGREYKVVTAAVPAYNLVQKYYITEQDGCFIDILVTYTEGNNDEDIILSSFE